jgi:hypothetical protein
MGARRHENAKTASRRGHFVGRPRPAKGNQRGRGKAGLRRESGDYSQFGATRESTAGKEGSFQVEGLIESVLGQRETAS